MNFREAIRIALQSLWANKLRSVLTLLGVVIGIASVIAVVTFINGINGYVAEKIFNLGADVFIVNKMPNVITNIDQFLEGNKRKNLGLEDYEAVRDGCTTCQVVGASAGGGASRGNVKYNTQVSKDTAVRGWTPSMARIYDLELIAGRAITDTDMNNSSNVAVIGYDIYENLFAGVDPINKEIRVDGREYRVIGVGKKEGSTLGQSRDNWVMYPISTWLKQYSSSRNSVRIWAKATGVGAELTNAMDETRVILRSRRHDQPGQKDSFELDTNQSFLSIWSSISSSFFAVTVGIASISLLVGGIVIMNIMLVSVTERTREIGIRKALGAKKADVLSQFLIESATMAVVGGALGVLVGVVVAKGVTFAIGMPSRIEAWSVIAGLLVSASVGIFFGVYPARRAADLDPIVALRSEL
ncbi:MAG TPA: ABC transporter permease [Terriglobales bacterium]|nr:ABC transporter permease [Terriglobales bacterium]